MTASRKSFGLFLALSFFPFHAHAENDLALRLGRSLSDAAMACANGNETICKMLREAGERGFAGLTGAAGGLPGGLGGVSDAVQSGKVLAWVQRAMQKIDGLRAGGALNVLGMLGGGSLLSKVEGVLGTLASNGGNIKQALTGGNLLGIVQDLLGEAKNVMVKDHLGDPSLVDRLSGALPGLASQLLGGQINVQGLFDTVKTQFGNDPFVKQLELAFGGLGGGGGLAALTAGLGGAH